MKAPVDAARLRKRPWALRLARRYARRVLARRFEGVYVDGLDEARAAAAAGPLLFCANHLSWWDAFVVVVVDEALGTDGFAVMDEHNLRRLPFFGALGALPLALDDPRRALGQLAATRDLLDRPGRAAWIFPQGRQTPSWRRPLGFHRGFTRVAQPAPALQGPNGCAVVPVSLLITFRERAEPALLVRLHPARHLDGRAGAADVEACVVDGIDALDRGVVADVLPPLLVPGTARAAQTSAATRLLSRLMGSP